MPAGFQALTMAVCGMHLAKINEQGTVMAPRTEYFHLYQFALALHSVVSCSSDEGFF